MMRLALICGLALAATAAVADDAAAPHPFSVHDMLAMDRLSDPQVSPDGKWVAYTVSTPDLVANRSRSDIWLTYFRHMQAPRPWVRGCSRWKSPICRVTAMGSRVSLYL